jgi:hypothetical protein
MRQPSFEDIKSEFDETLGYLRNDLDWLITNKPCLHYTVALLVGCGCEMLAACRGPESKRRGEIVLAELLPEGDWRILAERLYTALRDGLAHGFDTKHIVVDGQQYQISLRSRGRGPQLMFLDSDRGPILSIHIKSIATDLCAKITDFEELLKRDADSRQRFLRASQPVASLNEREKAAWRNLVGQRPIRG